MLTYYIELYGEDYFHLWDQIILAIVFSSQTMNNGTS